MKTKQQTDVKAQLRQAILMMKGLPEKREVITACRAAMAYIADLEDWQRAHQSPWMRDVERRKERLLHLHRLLDRMTDHDIKKTNREQKKVHPLKLLAKQRRVRRNPPP